MSINRRKARKISTIYITSLAIVLTLFVLNKNYYFGFNGHIPVPLYAGDTDRECDRTQVKRIPCKYKFTAEANKPYIALVGDSHAAGLSDVAVEFARTQQINLDIWTRTGCKFVPTKVLTSKQSAFLKKNSEDCEERNRIFSSRLIAKDYSAIIIAWRSTNCDGNKFLDTCSTKFVKLMKDSLAYMAKFSRIIVIGPSFEYSDSNFLKPTVLFARSRKEPKFVKQSELIYETEKEAEQIRKTRIGNVRVIDPRDTFCNPGGCFLSISGDWIMKDNNHLSKYGSMFLLKPLLMAIPAVRSE